MTFGSTLEKTAQPAAELVRQDTTSDRKCQGEVTKLDASIELVLTFAPIVSATVQKAARCAHRGKDFPGRNPKTVVYSCCSPDVLSDTCEIGHDSQLLYAQCTRGCQVR